MHIYIYIYIGWACTPNTGSKPCCAAPPSIPARWGAYGRPPGPSLDFSGEAYVP